MATRLHRIGTVFSRVDGAFRKGLIKEDNLPLWYNIYKRFPPKYESKYTNTYPKKKIRDIFYEEDILRAKIHNICSKKKEAIDLINETKPTQSQKLLQLCQKHVSEGMNKEEALKKIKELVDKESSQKSYKSMQNIKEITPPPMKST